MDGGKLSTYYIQADFPPTRWKQNQIMIEFNRLLLIACICIVVALILYFFYWNRFIAFVIGRAIRILYWNQEGSSIWVEIGKYTYQL